MCDVVNNKRDCQSCASKCCIAWGANGVSATESDIKKWKDNSADHILKYVSESGEIWVNKSTGKKMPVCPFLLIKDGKHACSIYPDGNDIDIRPSICITYPGKKKCLNELMSFATMSNDGEHKINIAPFIRRSNN